MSEDTKHLKWIHDRLSKFHKENHDIDYLVGVNSVSAAVADDQVTQESVFSSPNTDCVRCDHLVIDSNVLDHVVVASDCDST